MRTEADNGILAVQPLGEDLQRALEIRHGHALINDHSFDLMEHRGVGGIYRIRAVDTAGCNDTDRRLAGLHRADLHRRGLGAQQHIVADVESILGIPGGVALRDIQRFKVVVIQLDFRAGDHIKAHSKEDLV